MALFTTCALSCMLLLLPALLGHHFLAVGSLRSELVGMHACIPSTVTRCTSQLRTEGPCPPLQNAVPHFDAKLLADIFRDGSG